MDKVFIKVIETDGLKAALEANPCMDSIQRRLRPYITTFKTIHLDDFEIKAGPRAAQELANNIYQFLEHRK
jgi:hypothetical protein